MRYSFRHSTCKLPGKDYWLGASDKEAEGVFKWETSGKALSGGYTNWATGQSSNTGN